jgi:hypothetical protein
MKELAQSLLDISKLDLSTDSPHQNHSKIIVELDLMIHLIKSSLRDTEMEPSLMVRQMESINGAKR